MPLASFSVYNCDLMKIAVCFPGWIKASNGINKNSIMFDYVMSACLSCFFIEKTIQWVDLWDWSWLWKVLWIWYSQLRIEVQLFRMAFLNVHSLPLFESRGLVPHLKLFSVPSIEFFVSPLLKRHMMMRMYHWGHQWLIHRNPSGNNASYFFS